MVDITPLVPEDRKIIKSYGGGRFNISGEYIEGSILLMPEEVFPWQVKEAGEITEASLEPILRQKDKIEVLLIGTGEGMVLLPHALMQQLKRAGIAAESMDSGAASRTYNVLMTEGRQVAAAIIAI
jgi:uncharacterized protein